MLLVERQVAAPQRRAGRVQQPVDDAPRHPVQQRAVAQAVVQRPRDLLAADDLRPLTQLGDQRSHRGLAGLGGEHLQLVLEQGGDARDLVLAAGPVVRNDLLEPREVVQDHAAERGARGVDGARERHVDQDERVA